MKFFKMKLITVIGGIYLLFNLFFSCDKPEEKEHQKALDKEYESFKLYYYYPEPYDNWWRSFSPNLIGSEGWIGSKKHGISDSNKIYKIITDSTYHDGWGFRKGFLSAKSINTNDVKKISLYNYFPNFNKGKWLNNEDASKFK